MNGCCMKFADGAEYPGQYAPGDEHDASCRLHPRNSPAPGLSYQHGDGARCRSCRAPIAWFVTTTGQPHPFDAPPTLGGEHRGRFVISNKGYPPLAKAATDNDSRLMRELYTSHFATCPNAQQHRKDSRPMTTAAVPTTTTPPPRTSAPPPPPARPPSTPTANRSSKLAAVKRGTLVSPERILAYGPEGSGKSTLFADIPGGLLIDLDSGADYLDVARYPFELRTDGSVAPGGYQPKDFEAFMGALDDLIANPSHGYTHLGIDTADKLEALIHAHVCRLRGVDGIQDIDFMKGFDVALDVFRTVLAKLDRLRALGMAVFFTAHSTVITFKDPDGPDFDRYEPRLHRKISGALKDWCDLVGFVHFEQGAKKLEGDKSKDKRVRGWSTNTRLIEFERTAAWDAKARVVGMPAVVVLDSAHPWQSIVDARSAMTADIGETRAAILERLAYFGEEPFETAAGKTTKAADLRKIIAEASLPTLMRIRMGLEATAIPMQPEAAAEDPRVTSGEYDGAADAQPTSDPAATIPAVEEPAPKKSGKASKPVTAPKETT